VWFWVGKGLRRGMLREPGGEDGRRPSQTVMRYTVGEGMMRRETIGTYVVLLEDLRRRERVG
jgi:hypothetical protein